ncbi:hypothetical protein PSTG_06957 [Puccinia striiformis f. sp. tritici PST-78]|uniref:Uncharacterized protein n=1 Tax=Puccinia striiformis f. sp. tritici PST-78 TaxID=1165861 RepID=A0A0L0VKR3_9BASI|nr:hypothetical protein PSTG_06957 [Puccinia striiformis f. sp. tritici PST-78]
MEVPVATRMQELVPGPDGLPSPLPAMSAQKGPMTSQPDLSSGFGAMAQGKHPDILPVELGDRQHEFRDRPATPDNVDFELAQGEGTSRQIEKFRTGHEVDAPGSSDTQSVQGEETNQEIETASNQEANAPRIQQIGLAQTAERHQQNDDGVESDGKTEVSGKRPFTRKDEFDTIRDQLAIFRQAAIRKNSRRNLLREARGWRDFMRRLTERKKLLVDIEELKCILKLLPASERDRLFKLLDKEVVLGPLEPVEPLGLTNRPDNDEQGKLESASTSRNIGKTDGDLTKKSYPASRESLARISSPTYMEPGKLTGDVLDEVRERVTWDWLKKLNEFLHKIIPLKNGFRIIPTNAGNLEALLLQHFVFRTVELIHKHGFISSQQVNKFIELPDTTLVAAAMVYEWRFLIPLGRNGYRACFTDFNLSEDFTLLLTKGIQRMHPSQDRSGRHFFYPLHYFYAQSVPVLMN